LIWGFFFPRTVTLNEVKDLLIGGSDNTPVALVIDSMVVLIFSAMQLALLKQAFAFSENQPNHKRSLIDRKGLCSIV